MILFRAVAALLLVLPAACHAKGPRDLSSQGLRVASLTIVTAQGKSHRFSVEVAATPAEQERGLMFRDRLAPDAGMIFPMKPPRYASFWMKNTLIPLDMIFIRPDGTIARIAPETTPFSLTPVDSGEPVAAVLEIAGGRAEALGITEDDKVVWKP